MMRKIQYLLYIVTVVVLNFGLSVMVTGCGIRDSALIIPIEETEVMEIGFGGKDAGQGNAIEKETQQWVCVYVCGAVAQPGVYKIPDGSRIDDALQAAGGFAEDADSEYMNLAARITDGEKLYFPTVTEAQEWKQAEEAKQEGLVNINTADVSQLMTLPGIGEVKAGDIIAYREEHGEFQSKEELQMVPGIKESMYAKLCDRIVVN